MTILPDPTLHNSKALNPVDPEGVGVLVVIGVGVGVGEGAGVLMVVELWLKASFACRTLGQAKALVGVM